MKFYKLFLTCLILLSGFLACAPFVDSPFSDQLLRKERNLNYAYKDQISNVDVDGKIRIAILADPHQNYKDLDQTIYAINQTDDIDFVVNLGDVTNGGYNFEYDQFLDSYVNLRNPVLSVIGNHDAIGAGPSLFRKAFGSSNFWFESPSHRYIFFNSANLEDPEEFEPTWLQDTVNASTKPVFIFSHVNLRDPQRFSGNTANIFSNIIANANVQLILNGHNHIYDLSIDNTTVMLQAPRVEGVSWLLLEIQGHQLSIRRSDGATASATLK